MTLFSFCCFVLFALVWGQIPSNVIRPLPVIQNADAPALPSELGDDLPVLPDNWRDQLNSELKITPSAQLPTPTPTQDAAAQPPAGAVCMTDCAVVVPDVTLYRWVPVTITATSTVETVNFIVNPRYYPNVTGTSKVYNYPGDSQHSLNQYATNEAGKLFTTFDWASESVAVVFPTPFIETKMFMGVIGSPEPTATTCSYATTSTYALTPRETNSRYIMGPSWFNQTMAPNSDLRHWRLVPQYSYPALAEILMHLDGVPNLAMEKCKPMGHTANARPYNLPEYGIQFLTETLTITLNDTRPPNMFPNIIVTKTSATSLAGPGDEPKLTPVPGVQVPAGGANAPVGALTVHSATRATSFSGPETAMPVEALSMVSALPTAIADLYPGLIGPGPKPVGNSVPEPKPGTLAEQVFSPLGPGKNKPAQQAPAPLVINGQTLRPKTADTWVTEDGQELKVGGPTIELSSGTHGGSGHKMNVGISSGAGGRNILVVDGASMTLGSDVAAPTGKGGKRGGGSGVIADGDGGVVGFGSGFRGTGFDDEEDDIPLFGGGSSGTGAVAGGKAGAKPAVYQGGADSVSLRCSAVAFAVFLGVVFVV